MVEAVAACAKLPDLSLTLRRINAEAPQTRPPRSHLHRRRVFTAADLAEVAAIYRAGATTRELADRYNIGKTKVVELLREAGEPLRHQGLSPEQVGEAAHLYDAGQSVGQVARALVLNPSSVYDALVRAGVQMRPAHENRSSFGTERREAAIARVDAGL